MCGVQSACNVRGDWLIFYWKVWSDLGRTQVRLPEQHNAVNTGCLQSNSKTAMDGHKAYHNPGRKFACHHDQCFYRGVSMKQLSNHISQVRVEPLTSLAEHGRCLNFGTQAAVRQHMTTQRVSHRTLHLQCILWSFLCWKRRALVSTVPILLCLWSKRLAVASVPQWAAVCTGASCTAGSPADDEAPVPDLPALVQEEDAPGAPPRVAHGRQAVLVPRVRRVVRDALRLLQAQEHGTYVHNHAVAAKYGLGLCECCWFG